MAPLGPYFKNRELSDSLREARKRVNELVPFGVPRRTSRRALTSPRQRNLTVDASRNRFK
jgi:hypothetical protein